MCKDGNKYTELNYFNRHKIALPSVSIGFSTQKRVANVHSSHNG